MLRQKLLIALCVLGIGLVSVPGPASFAATGAELAEDIDNYFIPVFPTVYGEIINAMPDDELAKKIGTDLRVLEFYGYLKSMGDIANAVDRGDKAEAAIETVSTLAKAAISLARYKGIESIAIAGSSVGMLPLTALITTIDLTRSSFKAVAASQTALDLERLYYTVEFDPAIKDKGRALGEGDPIRHDQDAVEHLWRKVVLDEKWAKLFKTYVTSELGQEWPEPSLWESLTVPSDFLREDKLIQEQQRLKSHIASLLLELNKVARKREARVLLAQQLRELAAIGLKVDTAEFQRAFNAYKHTLKKMPEIREYVAGLPAVVENYRAQMDKADAKQLAVLRADTLPAEMSAIIRQALLLRNIPPTDRRIGSERDALLNTLKKAYGDLIEMRQTATTGEITQRLLKESAKLNVAGSEFEFTRRRCEKDFYDYLPQFEAAVKNGDPGASALVNGAKSSALDACRETDEAYAEDYAQNEEIYTTKRDELLDQQQRLEEQLSATSDSQQRSALQQAIYRLKDQRAQLRKRWENYQELHRLNVAVDQGLCRETVEDISRFVTVNANKYGTVQEALKQHFEDARAKYDKFARDHRNQSNNTRAMLRQADLEHLEQVIRDNPGGYAGLASDFLAQHMPESLDGARSVLLKNAIDAMAEEVRRQMGLVNGYHMTFYGSWRTVTLPCLQYMAGSQAATDLDGVAAALDEALSFFAATDPDDVPQAWRKDFDQRVEQLKVMLQGVATWRSAMTRAGGLAGTLAGYLDRAEANNAAVRADSEFLTSLYMRFQRAQSRLTILLATFNAGKASLWRNDPGARLPPLLTGDRIMTILDESRVLDYSRTSGLGLERLVQGAFCDIPLSQGMATITAETFDTLRGRIAGLPVSDLSTFWEALGKVRNGQELDGLLIRLCQQQTKEAFLAPFQFDDLLARAAGRLADTLAKQRAAAGKNQEIIDREAQKFAPILSRLERAIGMAEERTATGDWQAVFGLQSYRDETWRMYGQLGARRDDVDAAFVKLDGLIEAARGQLAQGSARNEEAIREFYRQFRQAYEARDEALLMNCMGDDWEAGDGTTLADLEDNLRRTFRIFDEIRVSMENLTIAPQDAHTFAVRYDIVITSRIYRRNIRHEEKSMVQEEVRLEDGRASISRTLGGRFWYVE